MLVINPAVGCHYFPPGLQLPPQPLRGLLPILLLGEQRHDGCGQFAYVCYPTASRLRFEPGPFCAWVQHDNHSSPSHPLAWLELKKGNEVHYYFVLKLLLPFTSHPFTEWPNNSYRYSKTFQTSHVTTVGGQILQYYTILPCPRCNICCFCNLNALFTCLFCKLHASSVSA